MVIEIFFKRQKNPFKALDHIHMFCLTYLGLGGGKFQCQARSLGSRYFLYGLQYLCFFGYKQQLSFLQVARDNNSSMNSKAPIASWLCRAG